MRTASAPFPHVVRGGAPVWLFVPPWQVTQFVFQSAPWHCAHDTPALPPARSAPWQDWQAPRPAFAVYAWNPGLAGSVHDAGCRLVDWMTPSRCFPPAAGGIKVPVASTVAGWQGPQPVTPAPTAGWGAGGGTP